MDSNYGRCVDWISKIPDEVLSHIFSFLPIRDVVRTSVLSKRWEYAWKFAPCLDLVYQPGILTHGKDSAWNSIPSLKRLVLYFCYRPRTWIGEEVRSEYRMLIDTPCLESLGLYDNVSETVSVNVSESLVRASINGSCASKVLKEISHVKKLSLWGDAMKNLNAASDSTVPFFRNLVVLELEIYGIADQNLLTNILTSSPKLEVLYLFRSLEPGSHFCDSPWNPPESPPDCLVNLKRVKFSHFLGTTFELSLVSYILEHALVLKKMLISFRDFGIETMYTPQMQRSRDEISRYRKGSSSCQVQFGESWICQKRDPFGVFV